MNQTSNASIASQGATAGRPAAPTAPTAPRLAVIAASWHRDIVDCALRGMHAELGRQGWPPDAVDRIDVPGAFEIPLQAQRLARSGRYDAIMACALVVDGGIYRHDFVATAVIDGLMRVQLDEGIPVLSAVLTPHQFHEHDEHRRYFQEHFVKKGVELAQACVATVALQAAAAPPT